MAEHPVKECDGFYEALGTAEKECRLASDDLGRRVFSLLSVIASFNPNHDVKGNPYGSMWSGFNGKRSLNAEDLTETDLTALHSILDEIQDPVFRARVADVLWVTKKNSEAARIAITAFLESSERLKPVETWYSYVDRLEPPPSNR